MAGLRPFNIFTSLVLISIMAIFALAIVGIPYPGIMISRKT